MDLSTVIQEEPGNASLPAEEALLDDAIVRNVLAGDAAAFEQIMRRYNQRLFRLVRGIVGGQAETEDVMQEAYFRAFSHLGRFEGRSRFSTWLTKIALNEAMAYRRKQRRFRLDASFETETDVMSSPSTGRDAAEEVSLKELRNLLMTAVDSLPTDLRLVFTLRMIERLSTSETAECLNLTSANVRVRLFRARSLLQSRIDQSIGEEVRRLYEFAGEDCDRVVRNVLARISQQRS
jgi:RNA polymerase sigma-70 factor (ECF subfamily)